MNNRERMKIKACVVARKWKLGKHDKLMILLLRNADKIYIDGEVWENA